ncbi:hypothetical protein E9993_07465 [Labilibacter sediminis]|nr:hypothetical protein E9993_07465 [Labilibacter sediminis]
MNAYQQVTDDGLSFLRTKKRCLIVQKCHLIEHITVFETDGTLVFKEDDLEGVTIVDHLNKDSYLVVLNLITGKYISTVIHFERVSFRKCSEKESVKTKNVRKFILA